MKKKNGRKYLHIHVLREDVSFFFYIYADNEINY